MTLRNILSAGVAGLALVAAAVAPAFAQYHNRSTPQERAQTEQLNRDAVSGQSYVPAASQSEYEAAQQRYQQQLNDYNARTRAYEQQRQRYSQSTDAYRTQRDTYNDQREDYVDQRDTYEDREDSPWPAPPTAARHDTTRLWTLDRFDDPNYELYNTPVVDADGLTVGHFRRVETRDTGERMAVVTLNNMRIVALPLERMFYDPDMALVVADLTSYQIDRTRSGVFGP